MTISIKIFEGRKVKLGGISFNITILFGYFIMSLMNIYVSERKLHFLNDWACNNWRKQSQINKVPCDEAEYYCKKYLMGKYPMAQSELHPLENHPSVNLSKLILIIGQWYGSAMNSFLGSEEKELIQ